MKSFNTSVICNPEKHYMVDISAKLDRIISWYIEPGKYFSINRGRQYGKTTVLHALARRLSDRYCCLLISFAYSANSLTSEYQMVSSFIGRVKKALKLNNMPEHVIQAWSTEVDQNDPFSDLDARITDLCAYCEREIILMIDETDKAADNEMLLKLLELLREKYIQREAGMDDTFKSVILAGVYDIRNLKLKIRSDEEHVYNSPWNVAAEFEEDLSFSVTDIAGMLREYENDYHTGMDIGSVAEWIYAYTSGYPVLVSDICKRLDENVTGRPDFPTRSEAWTREGIAEAVKIIQGTRTPLFEDMIKQIEDYPQLKDVLKRILFEGESIAFNAYNKVLNLAKMFDYIQSFDGRVAVSNRIFEVVLYDYFLSEEELNHAMSKDVQLNKDGFIVNGKLDMEALLCKFAEHYGFVYADNDRKFVEKYARRIFLMYLKPVINGTGNYYVEAQTRDAKRTDIVVDYHGEQFVVETKIWYGSRYNRDGEQQLCDYLEQLRLRKGYLLTFSFNKNKETGVKEVSVGDKVLFEVTV